MHFHTSRRHGYPPLKSAFGRLRLLILTISILFIYLYIIYMSVANVRCEIRRTSFNKAIPIYPKGRCNFMYPRNPKQIEFTSSIKRFRYARITKDYGFSLTPWNSCLLYICNICIFYIYILLLLLESGRQDRSDSCYWNRYIFVIKPPNMYFGDLENLVVPPQSPTPTHISVYFYDKEAICMLFCLNPSFP